MLIRIFIAVALLSVCSLSDAGIIVNITEDSGDLKFTYQGTINSSAITPVGTSLATYAQVSNAAQHFWFLDTYAGYNVPVTGDPIFGAALSGATLSGDTFGVGLNANDLYLPIGYVSNSNLSGMATFASESFASAGLTEGVYVWNVDVGSTIETVTFNIGGISAVPEPSTYAAIAFSVLGIAIVMRRKLSNRR
ncbi:MAG: PEP-CTERM sorting domain-containing protein [Puniceicoccaceae bacterium]